MGKKFTIETIKNLKVKVKDLDDDLTNYYTSESFYPDENFQLYTEDSDIEITDDPLVHQMISAYKTSDTEFEAGKILFESLRQITPYQASDIAFWTFHNHYTYYKYISTRWPGLWNENHHVTNAPNYIINHWIQTNSSQGDLIEYPISGLWWSFYLTMDEEREDQYELTKIFFKNYSLRTQLLGTARFARHKPAILGVLEFIKDYKLDMNSLEEATRAIVPYINLLGGIRPLSYFDKAWFKNKLEIRFGQQIRDGEKLFKRPDAKKASKSSNKKKPTLLLGRILTRK